MNLGDKNGVVQKFERWGIQRKRRVVDSDEICQQQQQHALTPTTRSRNTRWSMQVDVVLDSDRKSQGPAGTATRCLASCPSPGISYGGTQLASYGEEESNWSYNMGWDRLPAFQGLPSWPIWVPLPFERNLLTTPLGLNREWVALNSRKFAGVGGGAWSQHHCPVIVSPASTVLDQPICVSVWPPSTQFREGDGPQRQKRARPGRPGYCMISIPHVCRSSPRQ